MRYEHVRMYVCMYVCTYITSCSIAVCMYIQHTYVHVLCTYCLTNYVCIGQRNVGRSEGYSPNLLLYPPTTKVLTILSHL